jgi:hypothetical protein
MKGRKTDPRAVEILFRLLKFAGVVDEKDYVRTFLLFLFRQDIGKRKCALLNVF